MKRHFSLLLFYLLFTTSYSQVKTIVISHYLFPEFTKGVVLMKNGTKNFALLNYNSASEEMVFESNGKKSALAKAEIEQVDTVFIQNKKFVTLNHKFVELLCRSEYELYCEHQCSVIPPGRPGAFGTTSHTSSATSYSALHSGTAIYELKLPDDYELKPHIYYWIKKNGKLNKFINLKQIINFYDNKEDMIKSYIKTHGVKFNDQESIAQLILYMETN